jgi:hypothetical protein
MEALIPVVLIIAIAACIIVPIWLKHKLYYVQLNAIAAAIEKGIDPAIVKQSLVMPKRAGDINGNWKAGLILLVLGIAIFLLGLPQALQEGTDFEWLFPLIIAVFGAVLMVVHHQIVGKVVKVRSAEELDDYPVEGQ